MAFDDDNPNFNVSDTYSQSAGVTDEFYRWIYHTDEIIEDFMHNLRGDTWDGKTGNWISTKKPIINDDGVRVLTGIIKTALNKVTLLSDIDKRDIRYICKEMHIDLAKVIILNYEKYEIDKKNIDVLIDNVMNFIYIGLKKSEDGGDRKALTQSTRTTRQIVEGEQKGGIKTFFRR